MINFNEQNNINIRIKENYQKMELFKLTSGKTKEIVISILKEKNIELNKKLNKLNDVKC